MVIDARLSSFRKVKLDHHQLQPQQQQQQQLRGGWLGRGGASGVHSARVQPVCSPCAAYTKNVDLHPSPSQSQSQSQPPLPRLYLKVQIQNGGARALHCRLASNPTTPTDMATKVPEKLRDASIVQCAHRAAQLEKVKPIISYWRTFPHPSWPEDRERERERATLTSESSVLHHPESNRQGPPPRRR